MKSQTKKKRLVAKIELTGIQIDDILKNAIHIDNGENIIGSYTNSYPIIVSYFSQKDIFTSDDIVIGAHVVYGWMPKVLNLNLKDSDIDTLNKVKSGQPLDYEHLESLKKAVNNSIIGASKLLHFIKPDYYPIYDSNIFKILYGDLGQLHYENINHTEIYQIYSKKMRILAETPNGLIIKTKIDSILGYEVTPLRALELTIFSQRYISKQPRLNNPLKYREATD